MEENINENKINYDKNMILIEEYKEVGLDLRHQNTTRFLQIAAFGAFTSGLITVLSSDSIMNTWYYQIVFAIIGIMVARSFFYLDTRTCEYWDWAIQRGLKIEEILGLNRYSRGAPPQKHTQARKAAWHLYLMAIVFWSLVIIWNLTKLYCSLSKTVNSSQ